MADRNTKRTTTEKEVFEQQERLIQQRLKERKRKRRNRIFMHGVVCSAIIVILLCISTVALKEHSDTEAGMVSETEVAKVVAKPQNIRVDFLTINEYSRPGIPLEQVNGIVVHYTGNPGTTARQNHDYFEGLAEHEKDSASSHFIIGLSGEIIHCIPLDEVAYASKERNHDTISIECCIDNEAGRFNEKTYDALVELTAWLVCEYQLEVDEVIRHYDVTGKYCPKYFVEHPSAWKDFKLDVEGYIATKGIEK